MASELPGKFFSAIIEWLLKESSSRDNPHKYVGGEEERQGMPGVELKRPALRSNAK
jgi:hypothetical protein